MITRVGLIAGIGDALNARSFLITYCDQKNWPRKNIHIYTEKHWWMFEGLGFKRGQVRKDFKGLTGFRNFGNYDMEKVYETDKCDKCIALNAGIDYTFDVRTTFPDYGPLNIKLPEKFITVNNGYGEFSGLAGHPLFVCTKSWPHEYWNKFVKLIKVPCVQIGAGLSCRPIDGVALNLIDKTSFFETAQVLRKAIFHVDMEGGLPIFNQHLGGKSVVLFGPTAIENQGRSFNLNLRSDTCNPCYEWGDHLYKLRMKRDELVCGAHCMRDLTPEYVVEKINEARWI